jgi:hypothetical protein
MAESSSGQRNTSGEVLRGRGNRRAPHNAITDRVRLIGHRRNHRALDKGRSAARTHRRHSGYGAHDMCGPGRTGGDRNAGYVRLLRASWIANIERPAGAIAGFQWSSSETGLCSSRGQHQSAFSFLCSRLISSELTLWGPGVPQGSEQRRRGDDAECDALRRDRVWERRRQHACRVRWCDADRSQGDLRRRRPNRRCVPRE